MSDVTDYQDSGLAQSDLQGTAPSATVHDMAAVAKQRLAELEPIARDLRNDHSIKERALAAAKRAVEIAHDEIAKLKMFIETSRATPLPKGVDVAPVDRVGQTKQLDDGIPKDGAPDPVVEAPVVAEPDPAPVPDEVPLAP